MASKDEDIEVIEFVLKVILIQIIELSLILTISFIFNIFLQVLLISISFILFRLFIFKESWHLKNIYQCIVTTTIILILSGLITSSMHILFSPVFGIMLGYLTQKNRFYIKNKSKGNN